MSKPLRGSSCRGGDKLALSIVCAFMLALFIMSGNLLNAYVYSAVADYFGYAREIATLVGAAAFLAIGVAARVAPRTLDVRLITVLAAFFDIVQVPLFAIANQAADPALATIALCLRALVRNWAIAMFALCLLELGSTKRTAIVVVTGVFGGQILGRLETFISDPVAAMGFIAAMLLIPLMWCAFRSRASFQTLASCESASVLELTNPQSFLGASHGLFQCAFLFSVASGFALGFNEVNNAPVALKVVSFALVAAVLYLVFLRQSHQEDTLFSFSVLLVLAGFLTVPFELSGSSGASNTLIKLGENCFDVLLWLVVASIGRRNLFAALPVFCFARAAAQLGTDVGAMVGHASNVVSVGDVHTAEAFALAFIFAFFGFLWVRFRSFSFVKVIDDVEQVDVAVATTDSPVEPEAAASELEAFDDRCRRIASSAGLTARETEIFTMLARGRNGRFVMEHFVISRNTAKSHIKHIYTKLGVHSQQQLIDMVEGASKD